MPIDALSPQVSPIPVTASRAKSYERIALAIAALIYATTLTYPFNNDNALYAYMADLLLHGRLPYLGSWDQNFPAIVGVHVVPLLVGLRSQLAFHVWDILLQLLSSFFAFRILLRFYNERAALIGVVLAALYYVQQGLWMAGERDTYVTLLLLGLLLLATRPDASRREFFLSGMLAGLIVLFRPTYGLYGVILFGWTLLYKKGTTFSASVSRSMLVVLGSLLPVLVVVLIYGIAGGVRELWASVIEFNFKVYSGHGEQFPLWEPIRFYLISLLPAAIGIGVWWKRADRRALTLWLCLFGGSVISLVVLYRHSVYHYHPAMVLFLLLSAGGWDLLIGLLSDRSGKTARSKSIIATAGATLVLLFFGFQTLRGNTLQQVLRDLAQGKIHSLKSLYAYYEGSPEFGVPIQMDVGEYLRMHTSPGEQVQMFGPYSFPQYDAKLLSASRFQTAHAILMRGAGDSLQPFQREWRKEYLAAMIRNKPVYFIVCDAPEAFRQYYGGMLGHEVLAKDIIELGSWLRERYTPETKIGAFTLYRRLY